MDNQIKAIIPDDESILIEGRKLVEREEIADVLKAALQRDPDFILVIEPIVNAPYMGVGKLLYTCQRIGVPPENLRYTMENGEVVTFDELRARTPAEPV
ncbi:hypothetical protein [Herbaspirillum sp. SJZ107]|uniref:hypothetical protein n=1 Tax=Herbaspirillum sp. SJZ107 TaxID=2572881 RepID=UPI0011516B02|nr:hypothetical protein [Herbaspirillum sp. SJZ107]TQK04792.1 hypothetical protein FBX97_3754 [Herbaspirillum sp. SJZ107]